MKENIPEGTRAVIESNVFALNGGSMARSKCINNICWHIESILEEQRKELITQLPDDLKTFVRMSIDNNWQFTEEQVIKAEVAWNKLMERKLVEQRKEVLDEVKREVEELDKNYLCGRCDSGIRSMSHTIQCNYKNDISTIIDQLRLK